MGHPTSFRATGKSTKKGKGIRNQHMYTVLIATPLDSLVPRPSLALHDIPYMTFDPNPKVRRGGEGLETRLPLNAVYVVRMNPPPISLDKMTILTHVQYCVSTCTCTLYLAHYHIHVITATPVTLSGSYMFPNGDKYGE